MTEYEAWLVLNHRISRYDHADDINEALEAAKSALEKRVPKKPLFIKPVRAVPPASIMKSCFQR